MKLQEINSPTFYHGSNNPNLILFNQDPTDQRDHGWFGTGLYVTKYPAYAQKWGKYLYQIHIHPDIKLAKIHVANDYRQITYIGDAETANQKAGGDEAWIQNEKQWAQDFTQSLKEKGYDGVRIKINGKEDVELLIFNPTHAQIVGE